MGTIETNINKQNDLTTHTVSGEIKAEEIIDKINSYYLGEVTKLILWDFSCAIIDNIKPKEIAQIAKLTNEFSKNRIGGKTALIVSSDLGYGFCRMYEIHHLILESPLNHMVFRNKAEALEWLRVNA